MTCEQVGEMSFPLPFSITAALIALGLLLARFMKNKTRFFVTLLSFVDVVLKLNWIFLVIFLYLGGFNVSASIISYCLFSSFIMNVVIWRIAYYRA